MSSEQGASSVSNRVATTRTTTSRRVVTTRRVVVGNVAKDVGGGSSLLTFQHVLIQLIVALVAFMLVGLQLSVEVHDRYIQRYLKEVVQWKEDETSSTRRSEDELTYDSFACANVTAHNMESLIIPSMKSTDGIDHAMDHMLHHGSAIFPDLLDRQFLWEFRDYILWKNDRIRMIENIPVIENKNRYSFGLDVTEQPIIQTMLERLTTDNPLLEKVLEGLLGPDFALVELSTITSTEGAAMQHWHHDTSHERSAKLYGRSFHQLYTLLIPMQDTVTTMGSTWVAPGTHRCRNTNPSDGFPVAGTEIWNAGSGLLYNSGLTHRGGGHTLGPERAALIISFTSRPDHDHSNGLSQFSRSLPSGPVYAIRYDHWGFTWPDLKHPSEGTIGTAPYLSSYGIRKSHSPGTTTDGMQWGWTYWRSTAFRMMHNEGGFMLADLRGFVKARMGPFKYIPSFLDGTVADYEEKDDYAAWPRYLSELIQNFRNLAVCTLIIILTTMVAIWIAAKLSRRLQNQSKLLQSWTQVMTISLCSIMGVCGVGLICFRVISGFQICRDLDAGNFVSTPWPSVQKTQPKTYIDSIASTGMEDVLVSNRLHVPILGDQSRWLDYHPANQKLSKAVLRQHKFWLLYSALPASFRESVIRSILEEALLATASSSSDPKRHQILKQNKFGHWIALDQAGSVRHVEDLILSLLSKQFTPVPHGGIFWKGPCANRNQHLCRSLVAGDLLLSKKNTKPDLVGGCITKAVNSLVISSVASLRRQPRKVQKYFEVGDFEVGDRVDARFKGKTRRWWKGRIISKNSDGTYAILYDNYFSDEALQSKFIRNSREFAPLPTSKPVFSWKRST